MPKRAFECLLQNFVAKEITKGRSIPPEVLQAFTATSKLFIMPNAEYSSDIKGIDLTVNSDFNNLIDDFNNYIIANGKADNARVVGLCAERRRLTEKVDHCISLASTLENASKIKEDSASAVVNILQQLRQLKKQYKDCLKCTLDGEELVLTDSECRLELTNLKLFKKACSCYPMLLKALQKLNDVLVSEKMRCEKLLHDRKNTLLKYKEQVTSKDYLKILSEYLQLLERKKALELDVK